MSASRVYTLSLLPEFEESAHRGRIWFPPREMLISGEVQLVPRLPSASVNGVSLDRMASENGGPLQNLEPHSNLSIRTVAF